MRTAVLIVQTPFAAVGSQADGWYGFDSTHQGRYLCGWVAIDDAFFGIASTSFLIEDVTGYLVEFAAYGLVNEELPPQERQRGLASKFPKGQQIIVVEPYYKVRLDISRAFVLASALTKEDAKTQGGSKVCSGSLAAIVFAQHSAKMLTHELEMLQSVSNSSGLIGSLYAVPFVRGVVREVSVFRVCNMQKNRCVFYLTALLLLVKAAVVNAADRGSKPSRSLGKLSHRPDWNRWRVSQMVFYGSVGNLLGCYMIKIERSDWLYLFGPGVPYDKVFTVFRHPSQNTVFNPSLLTPSHLLLSRRDVASSKPLIGSERVSLQTWAPTLTWCLYGELARSASRQNSHFPFNLGAMSREELALQTQLLLQEATQVTQSAAVESVLDTPPESDFEAAKQALLAKLRQKKKASRAKQQQLAQRQYVAPAAVSAPAELFSPRRARALKLPVAAAVAPPSRRKQDMLAQLKTQAIQQGAQSLAKFFGYSSYEAQLKALDRIEKKKLLHDQLKEQQEQEQELQELAEEDGEPMEVEVEEAAQEVQKKKQQEEQEGETVAEGESTAETVDKVPTSPTASPKKTESDQQEEQDSVKVVRRRNRIQKQDAEEEDGNEADSEQDDKDGDDADQEMEDVANAADNTQEKSATQPEAEADGEPSTTEKSAKPKDKAAGYRSLLRAEAMQNRNRKRLIKGRGDNFVESEAEEDEEEDALKIGGLGDFGFGVPQAKTRESKEAEEERNALKLREDDLDHIVDDLSDDERAQEQDLEEMFRREQEDQDRQQVKEVMRNVKEGFGRNRRAFSGLHSGSGARGRFNLDELVAADGSKLEAARLGILGSDEELSEDEDGKKKKKVNAAGEEVEEVEEEEDEEAEMERMLLERYRNQPKIYVTSSESGSDDEEEIEAKKDNGPDGDEVESDEERERQQMKLFSERARINRRMQRMKDMQRQIALENNEADPTTKSSAAMPNLLLEEDEDSQELMHLLNRTDVDATPSSQTSTGSVQKKSRTDRPRPKLGRFNSYGGITSASRSSLSFSRVIGHCKLFSANSTGSAAPSKGFVFTSFSSDKAEDGGDENAAPNHDEAMPVARPELGKSKNWSGGKAAAKRRGAPGANKAAGANKKRKSGGGLFSVLSSFQCVSSTSQSQE
ncbi:unnamed protein product [Phytophthora lilii]|uniref:Unnamed protein product n=1 Tax=Phytophthora lilii TaxID=2077276 RepID=A0A9W6WNB7_9STRA|nr:unnamed protein product [Phytophthora lilii]